MEKVSSDGKIGYGSLIDFAAGDILYMLKDLPDACCIFKVLTDPFGTVRDMLFLFANDKYGQLVRKKPAELIGCTYYKTVENRDEDWIKFSYQAAILRQSSIMRTYNSRDDKWYEFWAVPVYQKGFCAFIIHDVTATKRHEETNTLTTNTNRLIIECATAVSSAEYGKGIKKVLKILGKAIAADRVYIVETNKDNRANDVHIWLSDARNSNLPTKKAFEKYDIISIWRNQLEGRNLVVVNDTATMAEQYPNLYNDLLAGSIARYIIIPLRDKKDVLGYLVADNYSNVIALDVVEAMESVAIFVAAEMRNRILTKEMMYMGSHDSLTGLGNRYSLNQTLMLLADVSMPVGVCYSDINGLKVMNDDEGHEAGDELIRDTASIFASVFNKKHCYRIGGDEFIVLIPEITEDAFEAMIKKLKGKIKKDTVSIGYVWSEDSKNIKALVREADEAMYESKSDYYKNHERRHG
ncbi:sensor domain-containing diguanylate cyclase [Butyrivibrio sp. YAB3001]|uniref:sensor domain-containing diguanylate cyclase n=1 Tax=Butyrivibrio sp. YAB3001 TaxID=1520812 RepID=UPI0008F685F5|nr:sensor domain-containing diguanylate cyclase [Butyrivibrio sp. YAB3001]SFC86330.1 diguanylate cyclase (GGDEF) domain-containing protein [Butyrivibrio sp. YAB3001]